MKRRIPPTKQQLEMSRKVFAPTETFQKSIIDGVDFIATQMERKWGIGRLRLIVDDTLRTKFDAQFEKFNAAIEAGQTDLIRATPPLVTRASKPILPMTDASGKVPVKTCQTVLPATHRPSKPMLPPFTNAARARQ